MKKIKFFPLVFEVVDENDPTGRTVYELLTLERQSPRDTIYFMKKGVAPSPRAAAFVAQAIEDEQWDPPRRLDYTKYNLQDFDINPTIFDTAGEAYADIRKVLSAKLK